MPAKLRNCRIVLWLLFIEDLLEEMYDAMEGHPHRCEHDNRYCCAQVTYKVRLGTIADCLRAFHAQPRTLVMPSIAPGSFEKKLYSMYVSYLPKEKAIFSLRMSRDERGNFTELLSLISRY